MLIMNIIFWKEKKKNVTCTILLTTEGIFEWKNLLKVDVLKNKIMECIFILWKKITEGTHAVKKICAAGLLHKGN